jgi:DNA helicase IV
MPMTAERLVSALWADSQLLEAAAPTLSVAERALLQRARGARWTAGDVPVLDEAAELLGEDESSARAEARRQAAERAGELRDAQRALESTGSGGGLVTAEMLAGRFRAEGSVGTVAERAVEDRGWTYGHVVVDEAQELSPMAWRMLLRRCPSRSMTVVGDTAQTSALAGATGWAEVLDRHVPGRWTVAELTVNYRTPAQVMEVASRVLASSGVTTRPPRAARVGLPPVFVRVDTVDAAAVARVVVGELEVLGAGRLAVVTPRRGHERLPDELLARLALGREGGPDGRDSLDAPVVVLDVTEAKGLEFDSVVVLEPDQVLAQSPRGVGDLYVALTRCTQRLTVVHAADLPEALHPAS